jgi:hypothetical protein
VRGLLALTSSPLSCSSEGRRVAARLRPDSSMTHDDDDDQDTRVTRLVSERQREFSVFKQTVQVRGNSNIRSLFMF